MGAVSLGWICGLLLIVLGVSNRGQPAEELHVRPGEQLVFMDPAASQQLAGLRLHQSGVAVDRWPIDRERELPEQAQRGFFDNGQALQQKGIHMSGAVFRAVCCGLCVGSKRDCGPC